jgi:hypothetical protein
MQLSDLSRIHWIIIGLLGGLLMAYMWTGSTDIEGIRSAQSQAEFERDLLLHDDKSGLPFIGNIVVHPAEDSPTGKVNVVTYKKLARDKQGRMGLWLDRRLMAKVPYKPAIAGRVPEDPNMTITDYLRELNKQEDGKVSFHYGWWYEPPKAMALGSIGGLLVIGGVWPTALGLISGAGLNPKPRQDKKKVDWGAFLRRSKRPEASIPMARPAALSATNVDDVTQHYEQNLAPSGAPKAESADAATETTDPAVRKLDAGPLEKAPQQVVEAEEVEVKGEFYPVVIRHTKKPE